MNEQRSIVGVLLAGGQSRRMGGVDKALQILGGRPLLAHAIERLKPQVAGMVINANGEATRFAAFRLPVIADSIAGFAGPLAGVHAGLAWVKANRPGIEHVVTVSADTPFFPTDLVARFLAFLNQNRPLLVARSEEGLHPVIGLWPVSMVTALEESLKQGERKASDWVKSQGAVEVFFPKIEIGGRLIDPFFNINSPEDLAKADALLKPRA
ncbi:MAG TPA: molybdenum cofactor guanylyltransferase MobA [Methyloceanibacter sp.]|nr:molybdenum cofactor guanylyltransferase MobA [Methyloceanibacter sp.]